MNAGGVPQQEAGTRTPIVGRLLLPVAVALLALRPIVDPDVWFHLVVGREVFRLGGVPPAEFYLLPLIGEPGAFHEWGFGLANFLVAMAFGEAGLSILNALVVAGIAAALHAAAMIRIGRPHRHAALAAVVTALLLCEFRLVYRPETFLYLALAVELLLLERFMADPRRPAPLLLLPPLAWLLAQCHPSVFFLFVVLGAYALQMFAGGRESWRPLAWLAASGLAALLASAMNPYGFEQLVLPFSFRAAAELLDSLTEFLPAWQTPYRVHALVATALGLAAGVLAWRRRRVADVLLLVLFAGLAWRYARNIALLALVLSLPLASLLAMPAASPRRRRFLALGLPPIATALAVQVGVGFPAWGTGADRDLLPLRAAAVIAGQGDGTRVANFYHLGNYLAWALPGTPVLVDGRNFSHNRAVDLHDRILRADPDWEALLAQLGIDVIVTPATLPFSAQMVPLVARLADHPGWRLAAREPAALCFVRSRRLAATAARSGDEVWHQVLDEVDRTRRENPAATGADAAQRLARQRLAAGGRSS